MSDPNISGNTPFNAHAVNQIRQEAKQGTAKPVTSEGNLSEYVENTLFSPALQAQRFKDLEKHKTTHKKPSEEEDLNEVKILAVESKDDAAAQFEENNPELSQKTLRILASFISKDDSAEKILEKVFSVYPDPALADDALEYLVQTSSGQMLDEIKKAKEILNRDYEKQVKIGKNIGAFSREFSKEGLGSPTALRDIYRDVTNNRRDPINLFNEFADKYNFQKMQVIILFMLKSLGADLKSKGPSIDPAELARLIEEVRSLKGILGVYHFFYSRDKLISDLFEKIPFPRPKLVTFENLAKILIRMVAERYMSPEKLMETAKALGLDEEEAAQIIIFTQMHDALRQISPKYFRTVQQRQDLSKLFVDTLEKTEKKLKDKKEEEKKKKKQQDKYKESKDD